MPESMNVEVAHKLGEHEQEETTKRREHWETFVEVIEVFVLAVVAVATAWGGYQATKWDGRQSFLYGKASSVRFQADAASTFGGQELAGDVGISTPGCKRTLRMTPSSSPSTLAASPRTTRPLSTPG